MNDMTTGSKIVDLKRQTSDSEDFGVSTGADYSKDGMADEGPTYTTVTSGSYDSFEDDFTSRSWTRHIVPIALAAAFFGWSGFFVWTFHAEALGGIANERIVGLVSFWAMPTILIAVLWLLSVRNSYREAARFRDVASILRNESDLLAIRIRSINEEISMARGFLAEHARELETIGRQSSRKLVDSAQMLAAALADSDDKAKTLETVSNAANTNLEQLRKHLPVVTSAAKDVTNQIGSAGNSAQLQIKSMIAALQRAGDAGKSAREQIDDMEIRAEAAAGKLEKIIGTSAALLDHSTESANVRATEMARVMTVSTDNLTATVAKASDDIDRVVIESRDKLNAQLMALQGALDAMSVQSADEQQKIIAIIDQISGHVEQSAGHIDEIDRSATEQTAKLAFAVSALGERAQDVGQSLTDNRANTDALIDRAEKLLVALETANSEISETLPASVERLDGHFAQSFSRLNSAASSAMALDELGNNLQAKLTSLEHLLSVQQANVSRLMNDSDEHFAARHEQAEALAASLAQTRTLLEGMADDANDKVVASLLNVRETTRHAAEASRQIMDEELSHIAERLSEQNRIALTGAVDSQISAMNELIQSSIERNFALSEAAASKLTAQLNQLDEMTTNLESRIADSQGDFESVGDDSFARRMVMLTESLNSTSIDVAKILSNDVTDTAWAAYLKGDRGVFTRRAVRLLDAGEVRIIAAHYSDDAEFREHVNRYIHDFESMMRVLLSTRDGNAIGVTLLSSDVGKLYVALAQAIERLRN